MKKDHAWHKDTRTAVKAGNKALAGNVSKDPKAKYMYDERCCAPGVYTEGGRYFGQALFWMGVTSDGRYLGLLHHSEILHNAQVHTNRIIESDYIHSNEYREHE